MSFCQLSYDKNHKISSQPIIKSGKNTGFRKPEKMVSGFISLVSQNIQLN